MDISRSWEKFRVRAKTIRPEEYCVYQAKSDGILSIFNCDTGIMEIVPEDSWCTARPVFFETNEYSFAISFTGLKDGIAPKVLHPDKSVESLFNGIETKDAYILSGNINFLNQPGRFSLKLSYTTEDGISREDSFNFDVVSPKMDTKNDLNVIVKEIKAEYDDLVFRYLTLTYQQFAQGREANNDLIWLSVFKRIVEGYIIAVRYILHSPHNQDNVKIEFQRPDRIKKWTMPLAEKFRDDEKKDKDKAYRTYYRVEQIESTDNTLENRFVKYTLERISERLTQVLKKVRGDGTSTNEVKNLEDYLITIDTFKHNSFFRTIGRFEGFRQESMVLQQRSGYAQVYRYWIMLQNGLDLIDGNTSVGVQPVWKLYELWCFLKVKKLAAEVLGINLRKSEDLVFVHEDTRKMFDPFNGGDLTGNVKYDNRANGDVVEIGYQYSFSRTVNDLQMMSMTSEQRPDIVMHIHKQNGFTLTYLFDAKYRVYGDDDSTVKEELDFPVDETLNQMHRYRDAIYYSKSNCDKFSKEVVGGYILFPGRVREDVMLSHIKNGEIEQLPYYLKSIETVNIGAFPLLPNEESGILLRKFFDKILLQETVNEQIDDSIPQRGLYYINEDEGIGVIFGCYKDDKHYKWILENQKYNLRLDKGRRGSISLNGDYTHAQYLVLYSLGAKTSTEVYHLTGNSDVLTKGELWDMKYPEPNGEKYLVLDFDKEVDPRLIGRVWDMPSDFFDTEEGSPRLVKYINLIPPGQSVLEEDNSYYPH